MSAQSRPRLVALDGIRGVAALVVLLFHLQLPIPAQFDRGYLMVDLFFMLSGFVLTLSAETRLRGGWPGWRFIIARYRRLLPVVFVGVAVGALVYLVVTQPDWGVRGWTERLAMAALLIPIITIQRDPALFPLNRAHWSLFFELLANILHALILWRLKTRALAALVAMCALLFAWSCHHVGGSTAGAFQDNWHFGFFRVLFAYSCGMLMARLWQARRPQGGRAALEAPVLAPLLVLAVSPLETWLGDAIAVLVAFPAVIWLGAAPSPAGRLNAAMAWLGAISYPLYAIHGPTLLLARHLGGGLLLESAAAAGSIGLAVIVALTLERSRTRRRTADRDRASPLASEL